MKFITDALNNFFDNMAKNHTSKKLLAMTDSRLEDIGLSRFKLEQGASAYPWKIDTNAVVLDFLASKESRPSSVSINQEQKVAA